MKATINNKAKTIRIKEWYINNAEDSPIFVKNTPEMLTAYEVIERMENGESIYDICRIGDSVAREIIMYRLLQHYYDGDICELWLSEGGTL